MPLETGELVLALVAIPIVLLIVFLFLRNTFVAKRNLADQAFATIDVMLKQRYDLIPNLVNAAKAYMQHEQATLTQVTALRNQAQSATTPDARIAAENQLNHAMRNFMVHVEAYPTLKADTQFVQLQRSLNETEAQIAAARRTFNAAVTDYNNAVQLFPMNCIAILSGFKTRSLFEIPEVERAAPNVGALFGV